MTSVTVVFGLEATARPGCDVLTGQLGLHAGLAGGGLVIAF
ncbi:hypothetical protein ACFY2R_28085 [Micromonospora olivasterospora]|nr:hypothetical protein [Micromonospora olivasterospora]